jgi:hypothetical protein
MTVLAQLPEIIGFFSYSREDDLDSEGALSTLRKRIQSELRGQLGRSERTLRLFQDAEAIAPGTLWENQLKEAIRQCSFFIPIVTPRVVHSKYCHLEFQSFLEREKELERSDLVFPIIYIEVPELKDERRWRQDEVLNCIGRRQYIDWSDHRFELDTPRFRKQIAIFARTIVNALKRETGDPLDKAKEIDVDKRGAKQAQVQGDRVAREHDARYAKEEADRLAQERKVEEAAARVAAEEKGRAEAKAAQECVAKEAREEADRIAREREAQRVKEEADGLAREREREEAAAQAAAEDKRRTEANTAQERAAKQARAEADRIAPEREAQRVKDDADHRENSDLVLGEQYHTTVSAEEAAANRHELAYPHGFSLPFRLEAGSSATITYGSGPSWRRPLLMLTALTFAVVLGLVTVLYFSPTPVKNVVPVEVH